MVYIYTEHLLILYINKLIQTHQAGVCVCVMVSSYLSGPSLLRLSGTGRRSQQKVFPSLSQIRTNRIRDLKESRSEKTRSN